MATNGISLYLRAGSASRALDDGVNLQVVHVGVARVRVGRDLLLDAAGSREVTGVWGLHFGSLLHFGSQLELVITN